MIMEMMENNRCVVLGMWFVCCGVVFKEVVFGWVGGFVIGVVIG